MEKTKSKRQQNKIGHIFVIPLSDDYIVFGRIFTISRIGIYHLRIKKEDIDKYSLENIVKEPIFIYTSIYRQVISKGEFTVIGNLPITSDEINRMPPFFLQKLMREHECTLAYSGYDLSTDPYGCIGYPNSAVYDSECIIDRVESYFMCKKNFWTEIENVILPPFPNNLHSEEGRKERCSQLMKDPIPEDDSNYYGIPRKYPQVYPMPKPPVLKE